MCITSKPHGKLPNGEIVSQFTLTNANGLIAEVMDFGATLTALHVPDRNGQLADIVLGKDTFDDYYAGHPCFGSTCGRVAGRISGASFEIDGKRYHLEATDGPNCLHGGVNGFHTLLWSSEVIKEDGIEKVRFHLSDPAGHNGFPGNLETSVTYALLDDDTLQIEYTATTDHTTPLNLTNHSYFNLHGSGDVLGHELQIFADSVASVDAHATLIGRRDPVVAGYNDYRASVTLSTLEKLEIGNADIHFFLDEGRTPQPKTAAIVKEPKSGRVMKVLTTEPGVQFYAGNALFGDIGKGSVEHKPYDALCLETQDYADSINFPNMGGAILNPGETHTSTTLLRFSTE